MSATTQTRAVPGRDGGNGAAAGRAGVRGLLWVTWRQHRWPVLIGLAITVGMTAWMLFTAHQLADLISACTTARCQSDETRANSPTASYASYQMNTVVFLPVLVAVFWGVPLLAREYEQRTLPLAWSQDVSPLRWLFGKAAILGTLIAVQGAVLAGTAEHLAYEYHAFTHRSLFEGTAFQAGGWLPLSLGLAWLAVGIAAGAATRRTMPAIAVVAGLWVLRMVEMPRLRGSFMKPITFLKPVGDAFGLNAPNSPALRLSLNDLSVDSGNPPFVDAHGVHYSAHQVMNTWCNDDVLSRSTSDSAMLDCLKQHHIVGSVLKYQPAARMGTFHLIENCANVGLLVVSVLVAWWCVRRTRTTT